MSQSAGHGWRPEPPRVTLGRTPAPGQDWHGDGLRLPSDEVEIVRDLAERTLRAEPQITATMRSLADEHEVTLVGLGHRIKTFDSIAHKMATLRSENKTVPAALDKINDIVRYRIIVPDDRYSATVETVTGQLHGAGQDLYNDWNAWSTDRYKGVNLTWQTTTGIRFETQFHTQQSHDACTKTHDLYKLMRSPLRTRSQRAEDARDIADEFARVPNPYNSRRITFPESIVRLKRRKEREERAESGTLSERRRRRRRGGPEGVER